MTLLHADGFDHWGSIAGAILGGYNTPGGYVDIVNNNSRTGGWCWECQANPGGGNRNLLEFNIITPKPVLGCGVAVKPQGLPGIAPCGLHFRDINGVLMVSILFGLSGEIIVKSGATTLFTSANGLFAGSNYFHIEAKVKIDPILGQIEVRFDGNTIYVAGGLNTTNSSLTNQTQFIWIGEATGAGASRHWLDDFFIWDDQGGFNDDFFGDLRARTLFPSSDAGPNTWTNSSGVNQFDLLNNVPTTADNISASVSGLTSVFGLEDVPTNVSYVPGIVAYIKGRRDDGGACVVSPIIRVNSVDGTGANIIPAVATDGYSKRVFEKNPDGNQPWTYLTVNAALFKVTRTT